MDEPRGAPVAEPHPRDWFIPALKQEGVPDLLQEFDSWALIKAINDGADGNGRKGPLHAQEASVIAACLFARGDTIAGEDEVDAVIGAVTKALFQQPANNSFASHMQRTRHARAFIIRCQVYCDMLSPFDDQIKANLGYTGTQIFGHIMACWQDRASAEFFPILALMPEVVVEIADVSKLADVWGKPAIKHGDDAVLLVEGVPRAVYLALCKRLGAADRKFNNKRGKQLERLAKEALARFMAGWSLREGAEIDGREKDFIYLCKDAGLAIECKALTVRGDSVDWSQLKIDKDLERVKEGIGQVRESVGLLRDGGQLRCGEHIKSITPRLRQRGLVILDEEFANFANLALHDDADLGDWIGEGILVTSLIDIRFWVAVAESPAVLFDYWETLRSNQKFLMTDEVEGWIAYSTRFPPIKALMDKGTNVVLNGPGEWPQRADQVEEWYRGLRPGWLQTGYMATIQGHDRANRHSRAKSLVASLRRRADKSTLGIFAG